jgi:hypothetical protein
MCLAMLIVCRKGILDPKTPANTDAGYPGQAMQFLAAEQNNSIFFLSGIQEKFRRI